MSELLKQAISELNRLPIEKQDAVAQWILDELRDEARWDQAFAGTLSQLEQLADEALADLVAHRVSCVPAPAR